MTFAGYEYSGTQLHTHLFLTPSGLAGGEPKLLYGLGRQTALLQVRVFGVQVLKLKGQRSVYFPLGYFDLCLPYIGSLWGLWGRLRRNIEPPRDQERRLPNLVLLEPFHISNEVENVPLPLAAETLKGVFGSGDVKGTPALLMERTETDQLCTLFLYP